MILDKEDDINANTVVVDAKELAQVITLIDIHYILATADISILHIDKQSHSTSCRYMVSVRGLLGFNFQLGFTVEIDAAKYCMTYDVVQILIYVTIKYLQLNEAITKR